MCSSPEHSWSQGTINKLTLISDTSKPLQKPIPKLHLPKNHPKPPFQTPKTTPPTQFKKMNHLKTLTRPNPAKSSPICLPRNNARRKKFFMKLKENPSLNKNRRSEMVKDRLRWSSNRYLSWIFDWLLIVGFWDVLVFLLEINLCLCLCLVNKKG